MKLTVKKLYIFLLLSLMANQAHGWWLTDWMFGTSQVQSQVEVKKAADLILITAAAIVIPSCLLGYKLYSMHKKNTQLQRDNSKLDKDLSLAHTDLHTKDLFIHQAREQQKSLQDSLDAETKAHATTRFYKKIVTANFVRYQSNDEILHQEAYKNNADRTQHSQSYIEKSREQKADKFRTQKFLKKWNTRYRQDYPERNGDVL